MNIAIIGSGGDGAGMNQCLYELCKRLKKHNVMLFYRGYQGIIDNTPARLSIKELKRQRAKGGIIIKSSRSSEFMTEKGFGKAVKTLKDYSIDVLIVMGGNGSLCGVRELIQSGVNCIFIPTTIDNDIKESDYCIGFDTAVNNAVDFVVKADMSMQAFDRICIYEVMGRHCPDIAECVTDLTDSEYCYTNSSTKEDCLKVIKKALKNGALPKIILQENVINNIELRDYLQKNIKNSDVKVAVVGYVQRGGYATAKELFMASEFAKYTTRAINKGEVNKIICFNKMKQEFKICDISK